MIRLLISNQRGGVGKAITTFSSSPSRIARVREVILVVLTVIVPAEPELSAAFFGEPGREQDDDSKGRHN